MEWLKQLSQAIDYMENNLASDISYSLEILLINKQKNICVLLDKHRCFS